VSNLVSPALIDSSYLLCHQGTKTFLPLSYVFLPCRPVTCRAAPRCSCLLLTDLFATSRTTQRKDVCSELIRKHPKNFLCSTPFGALLDSWVLFFSTPFWDLITGGAFPAGPSFCLLFQLLKLYVSTTTMAGASRRIFPEEFFSKSW